MGAHAQVFERIVQRLANSGLPVYQQSEFTPSNRLFRCSGRSTLTEGILVTADGASNVLLKRLNSSYGVGNTRGRGTDEYKRKLLAYFERELDIWKRTGDHPNIVTIQGFMATFQEDLFPALIFRYYPLGDLRTYIEDNEDKRNDVPIQIRLQLLQDIAYGLHHLHNLCPPIVHRDICGSNVLLKLPSSAQERMVACITDFGSSKLMDPTLKFVYISTNKSSEAWSPPEYLHPKTRLEGYFNPQPSGDIWSFGCTFLEVLTGRDPWEGSDLQTGLAKGKHPDIPQMLKPKYETFLKGCWHRSPRKRVTIQSVMQDLHAFVFSEVASYSAVTL